jgi:hypothetical protein
MAYTISTVKRILASSTAANTAVMLWGPPGIGKSDAVEQSAVELQEALNTPAKQAEFGYRSCLVKDLRLSQTDPTDLKGIPWVEKTVYDDESVSASSRWATPDFLPNAERDGEHGVFFLDEINSAPPSCQAAAYQIVLNRRLGDYVLPEGWRVVCAGNRVGDGSVAYRMPKALANRMIHVEVEADFLGWKAWAYESGRIDEWVLGFLNQSPQYLSSFDPKKDDMAFATPRSWEFVSRILQDEVLVAAGDEEAQSAMISGAVGEGTAVEFTAFCKHAASLPDLDAVMRGDDLEVPEDPGARYAAVTSLVARIATKEGSKKCPTMIDNAMRYCDRMDMEFAVLFVKDLVETKARRHLQDCEFYLEWADRNADHLN